MGFLVTTWRSAWILDGPMGGAGICGGGSALVGGMVVAVVVFLFLFVVADARGRGRKKGNGKESEIVKNRILK